MVLCAADITLGNTVSSYEFGEGGTDIQSIAGFLQGFNNKLFIKMGLASFLSVTIFLNSSIGLNLFSVGSVAQWCPPLCDPADCSPPGSSVHGVLQVRILAAILFSRASSQPRDRTWLSCITGRFFFFFTAWATGKLKIHKLFEGRKLLIQSSPPSSLHSVWWLVGLLDNQWGAHYCDFFWSSFLLLFVFWLQLGNGRSG